MSNLDHEAIRAEMEQIRQELKDALADLLNQYGSKLPSHEKQTIQTEFADLDELLKRLGSGLVWLALFGKTNVGKSAIANSLVGSDMADVNVSHDYTTGATAYERKPWMIVDVPGIMGDKVLEQVAKSEAARAIGIIFVLDGEPFGPENELFDLVHREFPYKPKFVFVNKLDCLTYEHTSEELDIVKGRIESKMRKYLAKDVPIIYGSAHPKQGDVKIRQPLPELEELLYQDAGTLGAVMNVLDPASRASETVSKIRNKLFEVRASIARKVIRPVALATSLSVAVPGYGGTAQLAGIASIVVVVHRIMGIPISKANGTAIAKTLLATVGSAIGIAIGVGVALDVANWTATLLAPFTAGLSLLLPLATAVAGLGAGYGVLWWRYCVLGEVVLEYIRLGKDWETADKQEIIERCKERASQYCGKLQK